MADAIDNHGGILNADVEEEYQQGISGNLCDYAFVPARVIVNKDEQNHGRIKVTAPGIMDAANNDVSQLPWVWPFMMPGAGNSSYSLLEIGAFVWLFYNKNNSNEFWYIPGYEQHNLAQEFLDANGSPSIGTDVLSCRDYGAASSAVTSTSTGGVNASSGGASSVVNGGTSSHTNSSGAGTRSTGSNTDVGGGGAAEAAVLGETLNQFMIEILEFLKSLVLDLANCPNLCVGFLEAASRTLDGIKDEFGLETDLSDNVSISQGVANYDANQKEQQIYGRATEILEQMQTNWDNAVAMYGEKEAARVEDRPDWDMALYKARYESIENDPNLTWHQKMDQIKGAASEYNAAKKQDKDNKAAAEAVAYNKELEERQRKARETTEYVKANYSTSGVRKWSASFPEYATANGFIVVDNRGAVLTERGEEYLRRMGKNSF